MNVQRWTAAYRGARLDQPIVAVGVCAACLDRDPVAADPEGLTIVWPNDEKPVDALLAH